MKTFLYRAYLFFFMMITGVISTPVIAQNVFGPHLPSTAISLMLVPEAYSFHEMEDRINNNSNYKIALTAVSKVLIDKGYKLKNFTEFLTLIKEKRLLNSQNSTDPYRFLMEHIPANVFIYLQLNIETFGEDSQVNLQLSARDKYTAEEYAFTPVLFSTTRRWTNLSRPIQEALRTQNAINLFCQKLDKKLSHLLNVGRKIEVEIELRNKKILFSSTQNNEWQLGKMISDWIKEKSILNSVEILGVIHNFIKLEAQIPAKDKKGDEYAPVNFAWELEKYITHILQKDFNQSANLDIKVIRNRVLIVVE